MSYVGPSLMGLVLGTIFIIAAIVAIFALVRRNRAIAAEVADDKRVEPIRRALVTATLVGVVFGFFATLLFVQLATDSRLIAIAPGVFGLVVITFICFSQFVYYRNAIEPGVAGIENRQVTRYVSRSMTTIVGAGFISLLVMLGVGGLTASEDSLGHHSALAYTCDDSSWGFFGPYPGLYYGLPLALTLAVLAGLTFAAIAFVAKRPRNSADVELVRIDDIVRRMATDSIIAAFGTTVGLTMIGVGFFAGSRISHMCLDGLQRFTLGAFLALAMLGVVVAFFSIRSIVVPRDFAGKERSWV